MNDVELKLVSLLKDEQLDKKFTCADLYEYIFDIYSNLDAIFDINDVCKLLLMYIYKSGYSRYYFNIGKKHKKIKKYHTELFDRFDNNFELWKTLNNANNANNTTEIEQVIPTEYSYPIETTIKYIKYTTKEYEPFGTQWVHDNQIDDEITEEISKMARQFDVLRAIKLPEQRTAGWYEMRASKITASDGGCVLGLNKYEPQYNFILKKMDVIPFKSNSACYHGKKYEDIATFIYEYRMNVSTDEFGLIGHPVHNFLGASPDRICNHYKYDRKHKSKYVGRMIEIKCPVSRKIQVDSDDISEVCPIYYWVQVQLQLECCDLEDCDFWQCEIREYDSRDEFIMDTDPVEPFRSLETKQEKGCLIQLIPKIGLEDEDNYLDIVYEQAKFIYPPRINMTPYELDIWLANTLSSLHSDDKYEDYVLDKVIYWKLIKSKNILIKRDREWFRKNLPNLKKVWNYVLYLQQNKEKFELFHDFIKSRKKKINKEIMETMEKIYDESQPNYHDIINNIKDNIHNVNNSKETPKSQQYMFVDIEDNIIQSKPVVTLDKTQKLNKKTNNSYMFLDDD